MNGHDVAVVGGGQAGLALGHELAAAGLDFVILDRGDTIGHVWRDRWTSLRLFTPARYAALPGLPFPAAPDSYPGKDQVADYLSAYATTFGLPVRTGTTVTELTREDNGFRLATSAGLLRARQVVAATGPFQTARIPSCAAGFAPQVLQQHSSGYRNPTVFHGRRVLVTGGGNSGFQIAAELAADVAVGAVTLAIGTHNVCVPQRILGRDIFWWQTRTGLVTAPAESRRGRWMRRGDGTVIGNSRRALRRRGIDFRPRLIEAYGSTAVFADGQATDVDAVVWATGFRRDHTWVGIPDALDGRELRQHKGVTPVPGLYTLGLPWQRTAGSALIGFVGDDAAQLTRHILTYRRKVL
ncbi:flavin-containing monooxygenase [Amycolatopsis australiensis]|uniref:Putative flavoprotein involved in K+ transport n=1 Tax=Amycolatopsis australiensis TaxID=546364 RepID=A0A1K1SRS7_9PSEU|nr:NAD(P)/FAD-dependent oxidoreductase [Amycolatopsis australiensis]SFW87002.1 putative flavoprotein involved in K+ transport [Amycolatopsis australiensis]